MLLFTTRLQSTVSRDHILPSNRESPPSLVPRHQHPFSSTATASHGTSFVAPAPHSSHPHLIRPSQLFHRRTHNPIDTLSSLHRLVIFEAHHLFLPMDSPGVDLPLVQTLLVLHLKPVSVQWMAGRVFIALEECSIIFPHHTDTIQSVYMPSCSILAYDSNSLGALEHFHISHTHSSEIKCSQWKTWKGTLQLVALHPREKRRKSEE